MCEPLDHLKWNLSMIERDTDNTTMEIVKLENMIKDNRVKLGELEISKQKYEDAIDKLEEGVKANVS